MRKRWVCNSSCQAGIPVLVPLLTVASLTFMATCEQGPHAESIPRAMLGPLGWPLGPLLGQAASQLMWMERGRGTRPASALLQAVRALPGTSARKSVCASVGLRRGYFWSPAISFTCVRETYLIYAQISDSFLSDYQAQDAAVTLIPGAVPSVEGPSAPGF